MLDKVLRPSSSLDLNMTLWKPVTAFQCVNDTFQWHELVLLVPTMLVSHASTGLTSLNVQTKDICEGNNHWHWCLAVTCCLGCSLLHSIVHLRLFFPRFSSFILLQLHCFDLYWSLYTFQASLNVSGNDSDVLEGSLWATDSKRVQNLSCNGVLFLWKCNSSTAAFVILLGKGWHRIYSRD